MSSHIESYQIREEHLDFQIGPECLVPDQPISENGKG